MYRRRTLRDRLRGLLVRNLSLYPPYLGAGIRIRRPGVGRYRAEMRLRWYNRNYFGTHFGGSLYSMCDPFFVLALMERLEPGWAVWDKRATIRFRRPGRGTVRADFRVTDEDLEAIRRQLAEGGRADHVFTTEIVDEGGEVVAEVEKVVSVRPQR